MLIILVCQCIGMYVYTSDKYFVRLSLSSLADKKKKIIINISLSTKMFNNHIKM